MKERKKHLKFHPVKLNTREEDDDQSKEKGMSSTISWTVGEVLLWGSAAAAGTILSVTLVVFSLRHWRAAQAG